MSASAAPLEWLLTPAAIESGLDCKTLAGLLLELARNVDSGVGVESTGITPFDPRLEQLRTLLLGREIELSRHFSQVLDDPEQVVSRFHAELRPESAGYVLVDLNSQNGTWVNAERVDRVAMRSGVPVVIGPYELIIEDSRAS